MKIKIYLKEVSNKKAREIVDNLFNQFKEIRKRNIEAFITLEKKNLAICI